MKGSTADSAEVLSALVVALAKGELSLAELAQLEPEQLARILGLGMAKLQSKRHDEAIQIFKGLVALDSGQPVFLEYLGIALEATKRFDEALEAYSMSIERMDALGSHPLLVETLLLRSRLQAVCGRNEAALTDLSRARQEKPREAPLVEMMGELERLVVRGEP